MTEEELMSKMDELGLLMHDWEIAQEGLEASHYKMLKRIGSAARPEIETLFGTKVNLQLWVKVRPDWRNSANALRELGYNDD